MYAYRSIYWKNIVADVVKFFREGRQDCRNVCLLSILSNKYTVAFIARILQTQQHGCAFYIASAKLE